jgi:hypothetical protein
MGTEKRQFQVEVHEVKNWAQTMNRDAIKVVPAGAHNRSEDKYTSLNMSRMNWQNIKSRNVIL